MKPSGHRPSSADIARLTIAPLFVLAGIVHLACPGVFAPMMPARVPDPHAVILLTGMAEIAGAIGLFVRRARALAGVMLALYAVCVYPVNIMHAVHDLATGTGLGWAYHYPRLFAQPLICWWALAAGSRSRRLPFVHVDEGPGGNARAAYGSAPSSPESETTPFRPPKRA